MVEQMGRRTKALLTVKQIENLKEGKHPDGGNLYLFVSPTGGKSWVCRFMLAGKRREMGLGAYPTPVGLADARIAAAEVLKLAHAGIDPIAKRDADKAQAVIDAAPVKTFKMLADDFIEKKKPEWRNDKSASQWTNTLRDYAHPVIGDKSPADITKADILKIIEPIWTAKRETARRLLGRIENIIDYAMFLDLRAAPNPAKYKGFLDTALPRGAVTVKHYKSMPHKDVAKFMERLALEEGIAARALEFLILNADRSGEVRGAVWSEFDLENNVWTIPAKRMKAGKTHTLMLSEASVAVLKRVEGLSKKIVFHGRGGKTPLSDMSITAVLRRMEVPYHVHGFRSTFRDWAAEMSEFPSEMAELQLAHSVGSKVEQAYRRSTMQDKRRVMMADWAKYCGRGSATVQDAPADAAQVAAEETEQTQSISG
jgi:integrase